MFAKVAAIVVGIGILACGVLVQRQQRYELARDISRAHWRMLEQERTLWSLRAEIARRTRPEELRTAVHRLDRRWRAIPYRIEELPLPMRGTEADRSTRVEFGG
ncbi:MAG: hypothetical protein EXS01_02735 [Phycisphaerales bacterium]|nr:hypothetical protein [Phycisphaerales bacterium]